jgi:hypothetical protein
VVNNNEDNNDRDLIYKDENRDRKNRSCDRTKEEDEANFRYVLYNLNFTSRVTLTSHYNKHKRNRFFEASF